MTNVEEEKVCRRKEQGTNSQSEISRPLTSIPAKRKCAQRISRQREMLPQDALYEKRYAAVLVAGAPWRHMPDARHRDSEYVAT